jgi:hypothetical protein
MPPASGKELRVRSDRAVKSAAENTVTEVRWGIRRGVARAAVATGVGLAVAGAARSYGYGYGYPYSYGYQSYSSGYPSSYGYAGYSTSYAPYSYNYGALVAATSSERVLAKITRSISASTAGFLMPATLREPGRSAASDPQNPRCSLPGDNDWGHEEIITSKSNDRTRFSCCAWSTVRTVASIPSRFRDA